jgi:hypothetical protein
MGLVNIALWLAGIALVAAGAIAIRRPLARLRDLEATQANLRRYESWRGGGRRTAVDTGVTGADIMRQVLRDQVRRWAVVIAAGVVLIVAGFAIR